MPNFVGFACQKTFFFVNREARGGRREGMKMDPRGESGAAKELRESELPACTDQCPFLVLQSTAVNKMYERFVLGGPRCVPELAPLARSLVEVHDFFLIF